MLSRRFHSLWHVLEWLAAPLLLFSGIAVLGYAGEQYGAMLLEQRRLEARWREQQNQVARATRLANGAELTRITIPRIDLSAVIVEGTDPMSLLLGPGHLIGTPQPGESGNAVVSAHRDTFFRRITSLAPGDSIVVEREGRNFTYVVEGFRIVPPDDTSVTAGSSDDRLTLITCDPAYYPGPAPQRLVVISKLVEPAAPSAGAQNAKHTQRSRVHQAVIKKSSHYTVN
jgi:sortase A